MIRGVLLVALLLMPMVSAAPYLQAGVDGGNTGNQLDRGPENFAVAFSIQLPGAASSHYPLIIDEYAFVPMHDPERIVRINMNNATHQDIWFSDGLISGMASDGNSIFISDRRGMHAIDMDGGQFWGPQVYVSDVADTAKDAANSIYWSCFAPKVSAGVVLFICQKNLNTQREAGDDRLQQAAYVLDAVSGVPITTSVSGESHPVWNGYPSDFEIDSIAMLEPFAVISRSAGGSDHYVDVWNYRENAWLQSLYISAISITTGTSIVEETIADANVLQEGDIRIMADADAFVVKEVEMYVGQWNDLSKWSSVIEFSKSDPSNGNFIENQIAMDASSFFSTHEDYLFAYDRTSGQMIWSLERQSSSNWAGAPHAVLANGRLFVADYGSSNWLRLYMVDASNGALIESVQLPEVGVYTPFALGEGVIILPTAGAERIRETSESLSDPLGTTDGLQSEWTILGKTGASIGLEYGLINTYPRLDEPVTIDLTGVQPGKLADDVQMVISWGDGQASRIEGPSIVEHQYQQAGSYFVKIQAANSAGQQARSDVVIHAGLKDPNDVTFMETAFSSENQETSFFILGLIVILLGSFYGFVKLRLKRNVLQTELTAADSIVAEITDDPDELRRELRNRRKRARRLFLGGRLDEGSTGILERHIDELLRDHRLDGVEAELGFLPHELFRAMQEILHDSKVTALEKNQFIKALGAERQLSTAQKLKVRKHVETWHAQDSV